MKLVRRVMVLWLQVDSYVPIQPTKKCPVMLLMCLDYGFR
jgi:hypothetical protein